jgi:hypothetical protein
MAITYDLRGGRGSSDEFYSSLSQYVDQLLSERYPEFEPVIHDYMNYLRDTQHEPLRTPEEYFFDFILLSVLWNEYGARAKKLGSIRAMLLKSLYNLRRRNTTLKPYVDKLRGIFATLWLTDSEIADSPQYPDIADCHRLLQWLQAAGDFREESIRLNLLVNYLSTLTWNAYQKTAVRLMDFAEYFKRDAQEWFGEYTGKISDYIKSESPKKRWKENVIFCARREIEYIMNLVGSELMNRAFRFAFYESRKQFALLPACMRNNPDRCQARKLDIEMICTGCDEECNVYRYREMGRREGFAVRIIPHSSDFSRWLRDWAVGNDFGVIGVACPLHLIAGGLELRKLNISAQCVFLDYCGCKNHWHEDGIMTDLNGNHLLKTVRGRSAGAAA